MAEPTRRETQLGLADLIKRLKTGGRRIFSVALDQALHLGAALFGV